MRKDSEVKTSTDEHITDAFRQKVFARTGGIIGNYESWHVKGVNGSFVSFVKPSRKKDIISHLFFQDRFITQGGDMVADGSIKYAKWFLKNNLIVCEKYPHGVAIVYKKGEFFTGKVEPEKIKGYYGFSQRGGSLFTIGDKVFDEKWTGGHTKKDLEALTFNKRGEEVISTLEQCLQAAINLSEYLS